MWKDPGAPWAVICSVLFLAVSFLKEGDFSHVVFSNYHLLRHTPWLYYKENQVASTYLQVFILGHRNTLLIWALNWSSGYSWESCFFWVSWSSLLFFWEIEKIKYHLIYLCVYVNRLLVVHCTVFKISKCLLQYPVLHMILNRLFFPSYCSPTAHQTVTQLLP